jgi:predicted nucleic acid-binding protein
MRRIFVDTLYWIAITNPKDQWHQAAEKASRTLVGCHLVTTAEVLTEVLPRT